MLSYSPYDNVRAQPYPHILITAGLTWSDPTVLRFPIPPKKLSFLLTAQTDASRVCTRYAGLLDTRVPYWESAKWASKLRLAEALLDPCLCLLEINLDPWTNFYRGRLPDSCLRVVSLAQNQWQLVSKNPRACHLITFHCVLYHSLDWRSLKTSNTHVICQFDLDSGMTSTRTFNNLKTWFLDDEFWFVLITTRK